MKLQMKVLLAACTMLLPVIASAQMWDPNNRVTGEVILWEVPKKEKFGLPQWNIKTNVLYDATATVNLGVEFRIDDRTSIDIPLNINAWAVGDGKWNHFLVQPELRRWMGETFRGHFFGLHGHFGQYNVGGLPSAPFSEYMNTHRFEGWLAGAGVGYGYRWNFGGCWALEATVGVGYAYMAYDKFDHGNSGEQISRMVKHYIGPTKAGISLIFGLGGRPAEKPQYLPVPVRMNTR